MAAKFSSLLLGFLTLFGTATPLLSRTDIDAIPSSGRLLAASDCLYVDSGSGLCNACNSLYYPNPSSGGALCLPITEVNCGFSDGLTDACLSCAVNYSFDGSNVCVLTPCLVTDSGSGLCLYCINLMYPNPSSGGDLCLPISATHCTKSDGFNNACSICATSYYVKNGNCLAQSLPNCLSYKPNANFCLECASPYVLRVSACQANNTANCLVYNAKTNNCQKCMSGFFFFDGSCQSYNDPNCSSTIGFGRICPLCNSGFYADASKKRCLPQNVANCQTYTTNTNTCTLCNDNSAPVGNVCP